VIGLVSGETYTITVTVTDEELESTTFTTTYVAP
jgi:hypothetical protein